MIIIVDDNSTDNSQDLIKSYAEQYDCIKYKFHSKNKGVTAVRMTALSMIKGEYVTYVDGDDLYLPNKLSVEADIMKNNSCDIVFSNNYYVLEDNTDDIQWIWANQVIDLESKPLFVKTITRDFPRKSLFRMELIRTSLLHRVGLYDENLKIYEDYDLRIRLAKEGSFGYSLIPTTKIRISKKGLSRSPQTLHYKSFAYIFDKYKIDINRLEKPHKETTKEELKKLLANLSVSTKPNKGNSIIQRVLKKLNKKVNGV